MEIIYISALISESKLKAIINSSIKKPLQSIQKFHRLLCEGLVRNNIKVKTYSSIPITRYISKKIFWVEKKEVKSNVEYNYLFFINIKFIKQLCICLGMIKNFIKECLKHKKQKIFICDILNTTISNTVLILSKIFKVKCFAIVTDLPRDLGRKNSTSKKISMKLQSKFDGYVFLTEVMNNEVNTRNKPYIVMEGIANEEMEKMKNTLENKYKKKVCIYAGGLYEKYGVKVLIEAFMKIKNEDAELYLFGTGELDDYINAIDNKKIKFFGVVPNDKVVQEEIKATLLINPRFTNEEYTKYSFPSKNMEYMASGTPILTTKLSGMPKEYYDYIYTFEQEDVQGIKEKLEEILSKPSEELHKKGIEAKKFVLEQKNNVVQAKKILKLVLENEEK